MKKNVLHNFNYQITFTQDHLYVQTLPITDSITNYLTTRSTNLAR